MRAPVSRAGVNSLVDRFVQGIGLLYIKFEKIYNLIDVSHFITTNDLFLIPRQDIRSINSMVITGVSLWSLIGGLRIVGRGMGVENVPNTNRRYLVSK